VLFSLLVVNFAFANEDYWQLVCPPDVTVGCNDEIWDLSIYGNAYIDTYGGHQSAGTPSVHYHLNSCGSGHVTRTWMVEDPYWNWISCTQYIYVGGGSTFGYHNITWPADTEAVGCNPNVDPNITGKPTWDWVECSMIGVSHKDKVFTFTDGCKKIMREWTLLNWCKDSYGNFPTYTHKQFIKIINDEVPEFDCPEDIVVSSNNCKDAYVDATPLVIDPSLCGGQFTVFNDSPYAISKGNDLSGTYPVGTTKVAVAVRFGCGMFKTCWVKVIVKNDKPPTPICLGRLNVALMGMDTDNDGVNDEGMVDIWAKDLEYKSNSACGFYPLQFSFAEDSLLMNRRFTCDDLGVNEVKMYVSDSHGNQAYCVVKIDVQNNGANITPCVRKVEIDPADTTNVPKHHSLTGRVAYKDDSPVSDLDMTLTDMVSNDQIVTKYDTIVAMQKDSFINYSGAILYFYTLDTTIIETTDTITGQSTVFEAITNVEGEFAFDTVMTDEGNYMVKCGQMDGVLENINTKDLDKLTSFILGNATFESAYQYLAADLNEDRVVDLNDLSMMIDYLKGDIDSFGENDWMIYKEEDIYLTVPEDIVTQHQDWTMIDSVSGDIDGVSFRAIQKGDIVDGSNLNDDDLSFRSAEEYLSQYGNVAVNVYPNPFDELINLDITTDANTTAHIKIYDISGRTILNGTKDLIKGVNNIQVSIEDNVESILLYQVIVNEEVKSGKLIKMKK
jgi:hypothetical protein